jgi:SH3 domain protein
MFQTVHLKRIAVAIGMLILTNLSVAETLYISDRLEVPMRSGTTNQHRIVRMLASGTQVTALQVDKEAGYTKVQTSDGREGWVLSRYLMKIPAARDRLATAEKKLADIEIRSRQRATELTETQTEKGGLEKELASLKDENRKIGQQLAEIQRTASSALAIDAENKELKSRLMSMERGQQALQQENEALKDRTARDWFMVGAGVVLLGIIVGLILPKIRFRKRSSWDTL